MEKPAETQTSNRIASSMVTELKFSDQKPKSFESLAWAELIKGGITEEKRVEEKQGECICHLSWSVHHNFALDGR